MATLRQDKIFQAWVHFAIFNCSLVLSKLAQETYEFSISSLHRAICDWKMCKQRMRVFTFAQQAAMAIALIFQQRLWWLVRSHIFHRPQTAISHSRNSKTLIWNSASKWHSIQSNRTVWFCTTANTMARVVTSPCRSTMASQNSALTSAMNQLWLEPITQSNWRNGTQSKWTKCAKKVTSWSTIRIRLHSHKLTDLVLSSTRICISAAFRISMILHRRLSLIVKASSVASVASSSKNAKSNWRTMHCSSKVQLRAKRAPKMFVKIMASAWKRKLYKVSLASAKPASLAKHVPSKACPVHQAFAALADAKIATAASSASVHWTKQATDANSSSIWMKAICRSRMAASSPTKRPNPQNWISTSMFDRRMPRTVSFYMLPNRITTAVISPPSSSRTNTMNSVSILAHVSIKSHFLNSNERKSHLILTDYRIELSFYGSIDHIVIQRAVESFTYFFYSLEFRICLQVCDQSLFALNKRSMWTNGRRFRLDVVMAKDSWRLATHHKSLAKQLDLLVACTCGLIYTLADTTNAFNWTKVLRFLVVWTVAYQA